MTRAVVCVATGRYTKGLNRLASAYSCDPMIADWMCRWSILPVEWPTHQEKPYAFKAYALMDSVQKGAHAVLWCDASILPIRSLEPLWEKIEREGYWIARNGWNNYQWTADRAYQDLFSGLKDEHRTSNVDWFVHAREINKRIPHVVATSFGLNVKHPIGKAFLHEYFRLASETRAFCGPWKNTQQTPCGPPDVLGHRHDQTAASVIAWRLGMRLTDCPLIFSYKGGETEDTILVADGAY